MIKIKTALLSVFNKEGILELAIELTKYNVEILSSGGTAKYLKSNNIEIHARSIFLQGLFYLSDKIIICLSGGVDSTSLFLFLNSVFKKKNIHVDLVFTCQNGNRKFYKTKKKF